MNMITYFNELVTKNFNNYQNNNSYNNNSGFYNTGIVGGKSNANYFDDFPVISWDPMYP